MDGRRPLSSAFAIKIKMRINKAVNTARVGRNEMRDLPFEANQIPPAKAEQIKAVYLFMFKNPLKFIIVMSILIFADKG